MLVLACSHLQILFIKIAHRYLVAQPFQTVKEHNTT